MYRLTILCLFGFSILHPCFGVLLSQQLDKNESIVETLLLLLKNIKVDLNYNNLILLKEPESRCLFEDLIKYTNDPLIILANLSNSTVLLKQSKELLILSCSPELSKFRVFGTEFQYVPQVILVKKDQIIIENRTILQTKICFDILHRSGDFPHILLTMESIANQEFYKCKQKEFKRKMFFSTNPIKPINSEKMLKSIIHTQVNLLAPFNIFCIDSSGHKYLEGYVANCVKSFSERYHAKLAIGSTHEVVHIKDLFDFTLEGLTNVASVVVPLMHEGLSLSYSYPLEFMEECFMIPLPKAKPKNDVFFNIIKPQTLIVIMLLSLIYAVFLTIGQYYFMGNFSFINVVFNDKSIRALLGQSFIMPLKPNIFMKYICLLLFYTNIMISTSYLAYFQSHLVTPALENKVKSLEDIRNAGLKIAVHYRDLEDWEPTFYENYTDILFIINDKYMEFTKLRDNMDLRYVYPVAYPIWEIYHEQQKLFQRQLFFYSTDLCLSKTKLVALPIRVGLPYRALLNQHLLDVRDTGLLQHWKNKVFLTLIQLKTLSFRDLSTPNNYKEIINMDDLFKIWTLFITCLIVAMTAFVVELVVYKLAQSDISEII